MQSDVFLIEFDQFEFEQRIDMQKYDDLLVSLRRVIRAIDLYSKKLSRETGLTSPQLIVMQEIASHDGLLVKQIAENINLSSATVTSILDRLERKVSLHLTDAGKEVLEDAPTPLQEHFINRFEKLEEWEQTQLIATMQRIAKMMDAEDIDAAPLLEVGTIQGPTPTQR